MTLAADSAGTVASFTPASGTFKVFDGTTDKTGTGTAYSVQSQTGCTVAISATTGVYSVSAMSADTASAVLRVVYSGIAIDKTLSLAKSKQGNTGASATSYWLVASAAALQKNQAGAFTPTTLTASAMSQVGSGTPAAYSGRYKIYENGSGTASYTSSVNEVAKVYAPSGPSVTSIKVELYLAGGTVTKLDEQTIPVVADAITPNIAVTGDNLNANVAGFSGRSIVVNGVAASLPWGRGHTVAVINPVTGAVESGVTYDTYNYNDTSGIVAALNVIPAGKIVAIGTYDATSCGSALRTALTAFGSSRTDTWYGGRVSHVFIGMKGLNPGEAYETVSSASDATGVITVQAFFTASGIVKNGQVGTAAITGLLTNESAVVNADAAGNVPGGTIATGTFKVFDGTTDKTGSGDVVYSVVSAPGVTISIAANGQYTVTGLAVDMAEATLRAIYKSAVVLDKVFTIAKSRAGADGVNLVRTSRFETTLGDWHGGQGALTRLDSGVGFWAMRSTNRDAHEWSGGFPVSPGDTFFVRAQVSRAGSPHNGAIGLYFVDANGAAIAWRGITSEAGHAWREVSGWISPPPNAARAYPWFQIDASSDFGYAELGPISIGRAGPVGQRGTVSVSASTPYASWADSEAINAIANAGYGSPVNRDIVTLYNAGTGFTQTKFYNNGTWAVLTAYLDGNLLVTGTVSADKLAAASVTADKIATTSLGAISANVGTVTAGVLMSADGKFRIDLTNKEIYINL